MVFCCLINIRLRMITNIIVKNVKEQENKTSPIFLNDYMGSSHIHNIKRKELNENKNNNKNNNRKNEKKKNKPLPPPNAPVYIRNIDREYKQIVRYFDLSIYGEPLTNFIFGILRNEDIESLWHVIGIVIREIPIDLSFNIMIRNKENFSFFTPYRVFKIAKILFLGTVFKHCF